MFKAQPSSKAFTIVELLIVIVVIAILAAISIVSYTGIQNRAAATTLQSDLRNAATQLTLDSSLNGSYPSSPEAANEGKGLNKSPGTSYQYTVDSTSYCITATSNKPGVAAYYISSISGSVQEGTCPGHTGSIAELENGAVVSTFAGSGVQGNADGTGTAAQFNGPNSLAVTPDGTVYVTDSGNDRIRKITPAGVVTTFATGFNDPMGIAVAPDGTLYVTDFRNYRVKKITPAGVVSIFAGSGSSGYADGTGTAASFSNMAGIAIASDGTVYVADSGNYRIRKITPAGVVSTFAGSGTRGTNDGTAASARFMWPRGIAIAPDGTLYVTENEGNTIRKIASDGTVTTFAGSPTQGSTDGTGASARFYYPRDIVMGFDNNLYVADAGNGLIRKVSLAGVVSTFAGTTDSGYADGTGVLAKFQWPNGLARGPDGAFYVADSGNNRIRKIR